MLLDQYMPSEIGHDYGGITGSREDPEDPRSAKSSVHRRAMSAGLSVSSERSPRYDANELLVSAAGMSVGTGQLFRIALAS